MGGFEGAVEQAASGQWIWVIVCEEAEMARGCGYDSEDAAINGLHEALADLSGDCAALSRDGLPGRALTDQSPPCGPAAAGTGDDSACIGGSGSASVRNPAPRIPALCLFLGAAARDCLYRSESEPAGSSCATSHGREKLESRALSAGPSRSPPRSGTAMDSGSTTADESCWTAIRIDGSSK